MFNSGFRGKRANDNQGSNNPQNKFIQTKNPQPYISGYTISGSDDTALDPAGGQTVLVNGTGFVSGISAVLAGTQIGSVTLVSPTQISFTTPANSGGSYSLVVYNSSGGAAILVPGLTYSSVPTYTTAAGSIGSFYETTAISTSVTATSDSSLTYSLSSGSLPGGATLNSDGTITGTSPIDGSSTTYTFDIKATDAELQDVTRTFTLTINTDVVIWSSPSDGASYTLVGNQPMANVTLSASSAAGYAVSYTANALPTGVTLSSGTISGTPTVATTTNTLLTATSATTNRTATRTVSWLVTLGDTYWQNVQLLLSGNTPTTSFINDASLNNSQITIVGDTKPNNFDPYTNGYYSNYLDGASYVLGTMSTGVTIGTSDFCLEGWGFWTSFNYGTYGAPLISLLGASAGELMIRANKTSSSTTSVNCFSILGASTYIPSAMFSSGISYGTLYLGRWHHLAVQRISGTWYFYVDGVLATSTSAGNASLTLPFTKYYIGSDSNSGSGYIQGNVSNVRLTVGTVPYAGSGFTVPTSPLSATGSTKFLSAQSNTYLDTSSNSAVMTVSGTAKIQSAHPFATPTTTAYNTQYSTSFNGSTDYISLPSSSGFSIPTTTTPFTIEAWVYRTAAGGCVFSEGWTGSGNVSLVWLFDDGTINTPTGNIITLAYYYSGSWGKQAASASAVALNTWVHIACVFTGSATKMFVDGIDVTAAGALTTWAPTGISGDAWYIGRRWDTSSPGVYFPGYISNFRFTKGQALYTSNFTPSTTPLTTTSQGATASNVSVLTCQSSTLIDNSTNALTITSAGQARPVALSPFTMTTSSTTVTSLGSTYFDGTGDYLSIPNSAVFNLPGDFTMEAWVYPTSYPGSNNTVMSMWNAGLSFIFKVVAGNRISFYGYPGSTIGVVASSTTVDLNKWSHVAATRVGSTVRLYVNGIQDAASVTMAGTLAGTTDTLTIGSLGTIELWNGYITDARIVKGTALYTANFLPSQTPLTAVSGTSLLTCQYNGGASNNGFADQSSFNNIVTRSGNATQGTFSPYSQNGWSTYFDGSTTNQYFTFGTATATALGGFNGNYTTTEFWIYQTQTSTASTENEVFGAFAAAAANGRFIITIGSAAATNGPSKVRFMWTTSTGSVDQVIATNTIPVCTWAHVAIVVDATGSAGSHTVTIYTNGAGETFTSKNFSSQTVTYDRLRLGGNTESYLYGYLTNFRVTRATTNTVGYTGASISVPTGPLAALPSTKLLFCQSINFFDGSLFNSTFTMSGTPSIQAFSPFGGITSTPAAYSVYMDGTCNIVYPGKASVSANNLVPTFGLGTSDFTVECWFRNNNDGSAFLWDFRNNTGGSGLLRPMLEITQTSITMYTGSGTTRITASVTITSTQWYHAAIVRIAGNTKLYLDGIQVGSTYADTNDYGNANTLTVSSVGDGPGYATTELVGSLSNLRVVRGIGVYTGNFTVPTSPLQLSQSSGTNIAAIGTIPTNGNSVYFDGAGDSLRLANNTALGMGTGDFTIEFWLYQAAINNYRQILDVSDGNSVGRLILWVDGGGTLYNLGQNGNARHNSAGGAILLNTWMHVALVRSSGTTKFYINGAQSGSNYTDSTNYTCTTGTMFIGTNEDGSTYSYLGYLSNFRMVKGTAVYTTTFTPSTTPLTAISGTSLLTCQSATLIDNSTNSFVITVSGNTVVSKSWSPFGYNTSFLGLQSYNARDISINQVNQDVTGNMYVRTTNPFGANGISNTTLVSYSPSTNGGSMYFDGTSDYLRVAANPAYGVMPASGSFTIEGWFYFEDMAISQQIVFTQRDFSSFQYVPYLIWTSGTSIVLYASSDNGSWNVANNSTIATGIIAKQWYHFAYTRNGSTFRFFVNGTQTYTFTTTASFTNTGTFNIGMSPGETNTAFKGYISDVRFINGVSLYNSNFFPVTTPLTPTVTVSGYTYSSAVFVSGTSGGIIDYHSTNNLETVGNTQLAPQDPYGGTYYSNYFDGSGDYLTTATVPAFSTSDFTIEGWVYNTGAVTNSGVFQLYTTAFGGLNGIALAYYTAAGGITTYYGSASQVNGTITLTTGTWYHFAITRSGTSLKTFINGTVISTATDSANYALTTLTLGGYYSSTYLLTGYISNFRIVNGTALYTSAFTPSTTPLTAVSGTSVLTCQSNILKDNSTNALVITRTGDVAVKSFNPFQQNTGKSLYFNGTSNALLFPGTSVPSGSGSAFTFEFWIYPTALSFVLLRCNGNASSLAIMTNASGQIILSNTFIADFLTATGGAVTVNAWNYVAITRTAANLYTVYLNGNSVGSATYTTSLGEQPMYIGFNYYNSAYYNYYIKDLRITKGVARYSATFTPPTTVLSDK